MNLSHDEFHVAARTLAADGWYVLANLMHPGQTRALADECAAMHDADALSPARIGAARTVSSLRGDRIHWFSTSTESAAQRAFIDRMNALRIALNHELMLGLVDCESHYAVYRPATGYARHLDRIHDDDARVVSAVYYLNEAWRESDGGALRLYLDDGSHRDILPQAGRLVLFLSAQFEHEVLPATRNRLSIACWMHQQRMTARR
ncbi:2OG-Fe(II) oxygenase [Lysobacter sp. H21R4]|uniref:2OG-Fe(II) oxygenase n=1 Tax=Lysobacter sp. H21R4 TaxID=2781021 RepID=UPI0018891BCA|nr:2OG-Fe(II) oxygenase [Lysobacter sp. H21R4]QOY61750.1 2OG-Fe(II) oxygenase [Lysobacter sp. H21R4]